MLEEHFDEDKVPYDEAKNIASELVSYLNEVSQIVDFFNKWDEQKRVRRDIKRALLEEFDETKIVKPVTDRFMELAEVKFK